MSHTATPDLEQLARRRLTMQREKAAANQFIEHRIDPPPLRRIDLAEPEV